MSEFQRKIVVVSLLILPTCLFVGVLLSQVKSEMRCRPMSSRYIKKLDLRGCNFKKLPKNVLEGGFPNLRKLDASNNLLSDFVVKEGTLNKLEILFLSSNEFTQIPDVSHLKSLRVIGMRHNHIQKLDCSLLPYETLQWLILTGNRIKAIPDSIGNMTKIRKLMLSHNEITDVSDRLEDVKVLEMIRIANNKLQKLPEILEKMPRLAWIAAGGNPFTEKLLNRSRSIKPAIGLENIRIGHLLGKGSGGHIFRGNYEGDTVAVKIYNDQGFFSDGSPSGEITSHSVLDHPNIAGSIGYLSSPNKGLVMDYLPNARVLGVAPSLDTITRDMPPEIPKEIEFFKKGHVLLGILHLAQALEYMHKQGFAHGDIYLHNTIEVNRGESAKIYLSDLGAAFPYDVTQDPWVERVEVSAFARLIEDIWTFSTASGSIALDEPVGKKLEAAAKACEGKTKFQEVTHYLMQEAF
eukprot:CAMPEP_0197521390 /NCGR_PEP_ID=MMETSP1318-20131121/6667_1 /TAXON_ID=552666 /ORGANISM="Partenskyella glossopodia, Strain RCC365" /LENGTH=463 /DNA_ID=CAMNT_0043073361 /DNA_START=117 /DNA_END=1508 /DNA_ORIENTATION=+